MLTPMLLRLWSLPCLALLASGCIDNRATVEHRPSSYPGHVWVGPQEYAGTTAPSTSQRQGHRPQELRMDGWRLVQERPRWSDLVAGDRVQQRTWPTPLPLTAWAERRWTSLTDIGSPGPLLTEETLERAQVHARSPEPWWQWFPLDLGASLVPIDLTAHDRQVASYRPVPRRTPEDLRQDAAMAGFLTAAP